MKKFLRSLMFDALLVMVLLWGLASPQSAAMNFVTAWAIFVCFACIVASIGSGVAYDHWLLNTGKGIPVNPDLMKVFRAVFCRKPSQGRRAWSLILFSVTAGCLLGTGWILTALVYLLCVLTFKAVRETYRQRIEGAGLCPESL